MREGGREEERKREIEGERGGGGREREKCIHDNVINVLQVSAQDKISSRVFRLI